MIKVIHIKNQYGKQISFCLEWDKLISLNTNDGIKYASAYAVGQESPFFKPLPTVIRDTVIGMYCVFIIECEGEIHIIADRSFMVENNHEGVEHPKSCRCETCRFWS